MQHQTPEIDSRVVEKTVERGLTIRDSRKPLSVYANHGRWLADCSCGGAEIVAADTNMVCGSCGLRSPVKFPDGWERAERLLDVRPYEATRNWYPDRESVDDLAAENVANGVGSD